MNGGKQTKDLGYTIVEVMVFLAVSGVMFLIAAVFVSGKQAAAQFTQGVNGFAADLQQTIQEAADGEYPATAQLYCTNGGGSLTIKSATGPGQGKNDGCVYLGKIVHFYLNGNAMQYEVVPVAGNGTSLNGAKLFFDTSGSDSALNALTQKHTLPQGISVKDMKVTDGNTNPHIFALGFFTTSDAATTGSGAQLVKLYYINPMDKTANNTETQLYNAVANTANIVPAQGAAICFDEGPGKQAAVLIGNATSTSGSQLSGNQLSVRVDRSQGVAPCS